MLPCRNFSVALAIFVMSPTAQAQPLPSCTNSGNLQIVPIESREFPGPRNLRILLPQGYHDLGNRKKRYPVVYLMDGQDLFDSCTSTYSSSEWRVDETVPELIRLKKIPPVIVVGIDHGGNRARPNEYLPYPDDTLQPFIPNPQGKRFPAFLKKEVFPFVERRYRVRRDATGRILGGSSYGMGIALYSAAKLPGTVGGLLLESPSIYADNYRILKDVRRANWTKVRIYLGVGTVQEPQADVKRLEALFRSLGVKDSNLHVEVQEGGHHTPQDWGARLPIALSFLLR